LPLLAAAGLGTGIGAVATFGLVGGAGPGPARDPSLPAAEPAPTPPRATPADEAARIVESAAQQALAARLRSPDALRLLDVRVWRFGPGDERAVCGTMQSAEIAGGSARFVVRVLLPRTDAPTQRAPAVVVEDAPGLVRPSPEAARRFCREAEPPPPVRPAAEPAAEPWEPAIPAAPLPAATPSAADAARPKVVTHAPANLRAAPSGEVLSAVPRGRVLTVFDRAPGGWAQVGDGTPQGWIHSSLLSDPAAPPR
jgi:hypothetical protein